MLAQCIPQWIQEGEARGEAHIKIRFISGVGEITRLFC